MASRRFWPKKEITVTTTFITNNRKNFKVCKHFTPVKGTNWLNIFQPWKRNLLEISPSFLAHSFREGTPHFSKGPNWCSIASMGAVHPKYNLNKVALSLIAKVKIKSKVSIEYYPTIMWGLIENRFPNQKNTIRRYTLVWFLMIFQLNKFTFWNKQSVWKVSFTSMDGNRKRIMAISSCVSLVKVKPVLFFLWTKRRLRVWMTSVQSSYQLLRCGTNLVELAQLLCLKNLLRN